MHEIVSTTDLAWALAVVVGLIFVLRTAMRASGFEAAGAKSRSIRIVDSAAIGTRRRVLVVEADSQRLLLATSESGIQLLKVLGSAETVDERVADTDEPVDGDAVEPKNRWATLGLFGAAVVAVCSLAAPGEALAAELSAEGLSVSLGGPEGLSSSIELLGLLTLISVAPSLLLMATCFTRIVIVLAFVRQAIGVQQLPPNQVLVGLALFLTLFVMAPLGEQIRSDAYQPYIDGELEAEEAFERGVAPVRRYLMSYTRESDLALFLDVSGTAAAASDEADPDLRVLLPAFLLSELRTAFEIGFTIFLPFLVIDLVVASMLISMGMIVLPPIVVSLPFKLMLFVLVDGWNLVLTALVDGLNR